MPDERKQSLHRMANSIYMNYTGDRTRTLQHQEVLLLLPQLMKLVPHVDAFIKHQRVNAHLSTLLTGDKLGLFLLYAEYPRSSIMATFSWFHDVDELLKRATQDHAYDDADSVKIAA
eukprot:scaffold296174_cov22-Tisochrysis_lutea.AAC.1